jgi:hypothetical protein
VKKGQSNTSRLPGNAEEDGHRCGFLHLSGTRFNFVVDAASAAAWKKGYQRGKRERLKELAEQRILPRSLDGPGAVPHPEEFRVFDRRNVRAYRKGKR